MVEGDAPVAGARHALQAVLADRLADLAGEDEGGVASHQVTTILA